MGLHKEMRMEAFALWEKPEEIANSITHGLGFVLSVAAACFLVSLATLRGDAWHIAGCGIYASSLVAVYLASTLSHMFQRPRLKRLFRILDQAFIYLLIVGTFTPFSLAYLRSGWWWLLFGMMWGVGIVGFLSKILLAHRVEAVSTSLYVLMGWMPAMAAKPMAALIPSGALLWMLAGGLFYTIGVLFLTLDEKVPYFHSVWHLCVIGGSTCHYLAILFYVVP